VDKVIDRMMPLMDTDDGSIGLVNIGETGDFAVLERTRTMPEIVRHRFHLDTPMRHCPDIFPAEPLG
jgi:hypothetical protein